MNAANPTFILADDLTGALDCGAAFAARGFSTCVALRSDIPAPAGSRVIAINADTRRLPADRAAATAEAAIASITRSGGNLQYVKIDSTLRGHPGLEIGIAARASEARLVLVAPTFPATGRTVRNGELLVQGVPLAETEVGKDPLSPVTTSNVAEVIRGHSELRVHSLSLEAVRSDRLGDMLRDLAGFSSSDAPALVTCDAETEQDLDALMSGGLQVESQASTGDDPNPVRTLFAGSAGLAAALARATRDGADNHAETAPALSPPVIIVTASQRALADRQIAALAEAGLAKAWPVEFGQAGLGHSGRAYVDRAAIRSALGENENVALRATLGTDLTAASPAAVRAAADSVTRQVGELVSGLVAEHRIGGLVIIGGDTAFAALAAVEARGIVLAAEPLPGVAVGTISGGSLDGVTIATKAGAFGDDRTLVELFYKLTPGGEQH